MATSGRLTIIFLVLLLFAATSLAHSVPGVAGRLTPTTHPAFLLIGQSAPFRSVSLPLGMLLYLPPGIDFAHYRAGRIPEPVTDIGRLFAATQYHWIFPFHLPESAQMIQFTVSADTVSLTSDGGEISVGSVVRYLDDRKDRVSLVRAAFRPVWSTTVNRVRVDLGYSLSAVPFEALGGEGIAELLGGESLLPSTRYNLSVRSVADFSIATRVTAGLSVPLGNGELIPAIRLKVPLSLAHADTLVDIWARTADGALPVETGTAWQVTYWYPGTGFGTGALVDVGVAYSTSSWTIGVGANEVGALWYSSGVSIGTASKTGSTGLELWSQPVPTVAALYQTRSATGDPVVLSGTAQFREGLRFAAGIAINTAPHWIVFGAGYDKGPALGLGFGLGFPGFYVEPSIEIRTDLLSAKPVAGLSVQIARGTSRYRAPGLAPGEAE